MMYSRFIQAVRLARAIYLLENTPMPIGEIVARLHYQDAYYFTVQFKKKTGLTPSAFRESRQVRTDYSML